MRFARNASALGINSQLGINMHIAFHPVPADKNARAMGTEYGIGSIFGIGFRVITYLLDYPFLIPAPCIMRYEAGYSSPALSIGRENLRIFPHLGYGCAAGDERRSLSAR